MASTKRYFIDFGSESIDATVDADADLDGTFTAVCNDTGQTLRVNGWLILSLEELEG
ncbi:MAG: hypothetical protein M3Q08_00960 [Pseudomonadota bacterium]|nr:hypothetical protein [Pseudomonadota bacterium]